MTHAATGFLVVVMWVASLSAQETAMHEDSLTITLQPAGDAALKACAAFLAPRLRLLVEGEQDVRLELRATRLEPLRARFTLLENGAVLTSRDNIQDDGGFDNLSLWLAMKSAWSRSQVYRFSKAPAVDVRVPPRSRRAKKKSPRRRVSLAARAILQGDDLSAYGASIGRGRGRDRFSLLGDFGYARAPVDQSLTVHHLFAEGHASYALVEGLAVEGTVRLSSVIADTGANTVSGADFGAGAGAQIWLDTVPRAWVRATVLGHPVQQKYLLDSGERRSSLVTLTVSVGVEL